MDRYFVTMKRYAQILFIFSAIFIWIDISEQGKDILKYYLYFLPFLYGYDWDIEFYQVEDSY